MKSKNINKKRNGNGRQYRVGKYQAVKTETTIEEIYTSLVAITQSATDEPTKDEPACDLSVFKKFDIEDLEKHLSELVYRIIDLEDYHLGRKLMEDYPRDKFQTALLVFKKRYASADKKACKANRIRRAQLREELRHLREKIDSDSKSIADNLQRSNYFQNNLRGDEEKLKARFGKCMKVGFIMRMCKCYRLPTARIKSYKARIESLNIDTARLEEERRQLTQEFSQKETEFNSLDCTEAAVSLNLVSDCLSEIHTWLRYNGGRSSAATENKQRISDERVDNLKSLIVPCKFDDIALQQLADEAKADDHSYNAALLSALIDNNCIQDRYDNKFERIKRDFYKAIGFDTNNLGTARKDMSSKAKISEAKDFIQALLDETQSRKNATKP